MNEGFATACPNITNAVIRGHNAYASAILNSFFEGLEINFTQSLLGAPSVHRVTLVLGFVKDEMLEIAIFTGVGKTANLLCQHSACKEAILREILVVSTTPCTTVQVCTKAVGAVHSDTLYAHFLAVVNTKAISQGLVPGLTQYGCAGEACATLCTCVKGTNLRGSIVVGELRLANRGQRRVTKVTCVNEFNRFAKGDLAQDNIPQRMIVIGTKQQTKLGNLTVCINQCVAALVVNDAVILYTTRTLAPYNTRVVNGIAENIGFGIVPIACRFFRVFIVFLNVVCHFAVFNVCNCIRIREICTADKANVLTAVATVDADTVDSIRTCKLVGYGVAGYVINQEIDSLGYVVSDDTGGTGCTTCEIYGFDIVRVGHQLELVRACIKLVALVAIVVQIVCVVTSKIFYVNGNGKGLLFTGIDGTRFCKGNQIDVCLFDLPSLIFGSEINLDNILSRNRTDVGNRKCDGDLAFTIDFGAVCQRKRFYRPFKGGIGKSKSKRVLYNTFVTRNGDFVIIFVKNLSGIGIPNSLGISGLIPLVAKVNALDVIDKRGSGTSGSTCIAAGTRGINVGCTCVVTNACCTCALEVDVACHIIRIGIGKATGGRYLAPQNRGDRLCSLRTGCTNYKTCINTGNGIYKIKLHCVGGVDDNDNVLVICTYVFEHFFLFGRNFKIVAACIYRGVGIYLVLHSCGVLGLTCVAADDNKCCARIILCIIEERSGVIVGIGNTRLCQTVERIVVVINRTDVAKGGGKFAIHGDKTLVVGNTVQLQSFQEVDIFGRIVVFGKYLTRTRSAVHPVDGCVAKYVDLRNCIGAQRKNTVVFDKNTSLFDNLFGKFLTSFSCLVDGVAVCGKRMEVQNLLKIRLQTCDV